MRTKITEPRNKPRRTWRNLFRRRQRRHDPMLVLSLTDFNYLRGWDRLLSNYDSYRSAA